MALLDSVHFEVEVTASAAALTALAGNKSIRWISIQPDGANVGAVYIGGAGVTSSSYGSKLPAPVDGIPPPPFIIGEFEDGTMGPQNIYIVGTADDSVHVHVLVYNFPGVKQGTF